MRTILVPTGTANLASVRAGLERAGATVTESLDPVELEEAPRVVLPGVGAFAPAMERLVESGAARALVRRVEAGRPLLAVCLGLQLLCRSSEENPGVDGLGVLDGEVRRLRGPGRIPHIGWNAVRPDPGLRWIEPGYAYFANSYALDGPVAGAPRAVAEHGTRFTAAVERGPLLACQFHPELSGAWGAALLSRWVEQRAREDVPC